MYVRNLQITTLYIHTYTYRIRYLHVTNRVPVNSEENERQQCVQNGQNLRKRGFRGVQYTVLASQSAK